MSKLLMYSNYYAKNIYRICRHTQGYYHTLQVLSNLYDYAVFQFSMEIQVLGCYFSNLYNADTRITKRTIVRAWRWYSLWSYKLCSPADTPRDQKMAGRILYLLASCSLALAEITQLQMTDCGNSYKDLFSLSIYCFKIDNFHIIYMY